jgi:ssDNA-binding Zn-finger/Zn-ribbon topoisomerase 1/predicted Ser/Thr protein kinase
MFLPNAQQYQEAVQNPRFVFDDPELKLCVPYVNKFNMPISSAGGFAIVFKFKGTGRDWAVRCFTRAAGDQEQRYAAINAHIKSCKLPYTVSFDYLRKGILVNGKWHPILKMEWAEGQRLDSFICTHLNQPDKLVDMSHAWLKMAADLKAAGIAHGDLQHGNVLVHNGRLRLVDYDGMYVPSLRGKPANEVGHRNYQHPSRNQKHFDLYLDNFSAWVVYMSMVALSVEPMLWTKRTDDESLLVGSTDYHNPGHSQALIHLRSHSDARIKSLSAKLVDMLSVPVEKVPELTPTTVGTMPAKVGALPAWLYAYKTAGAPASNLCPRCKGNLVKKTHRQLQMQFWECSNAPACPYRRADSDGVQPTVSQPLPASGTLFPGPQSATNVGTTSTPNPIISSTPVATPTSGVSQSPKKRGRKPSTSTTKTRTRKRSTPLVTLAIDECDICGSKLQVVNGAQSFYVCTNYPACNFTKPC